MLSYMKEKNIKSGFTLIELAVVVIIIGLLISGIIAGQNLVSLSRLSSARALTNSSPVNNIENLVVWLEATSKDSFAGNERIDGNSVSQWDDINQQETVKIDVAQAGATRPVYTKNTLNGLPALVYTNDSFSNSNVLAGDLANNGEVTIFTVAKNDGDTTFAGFAFFFSGTNRIGFDFTFPNMHWNYGVCCTNTRLGYNISEYSGEWFIATGFRRNSGAAIRINGTEVSQNSTLGPVISSSQAGTFHVGRGTADALYGGIVEVIVFDRGLSSFEIDQVEEYLSKKWKISLSN